MQHLTAGELAAGVDEIRRSPADAGTVELIVRRPAVGARQPVAEATLDRDHGLVGDGWSERAPHETAGPIRIASSP